MLSRVAAVKAPRTHNRRRMTGSRGRRKEGRESERQRPNMSRRAFTSAVLLLLVVLMCCGSGAVIAKEAVSSLKSSPEKHFGWRDVKTEEETVDSLYVPSLVKVNGDVFAVAEAQCKKKEGCSFTGIASELLKLNEKQKEELDKTKLKTQVLEEWPSEQVERPCRIADQAVSQGVKNSHVSRPTTVAKESVIYMLAGNYSWTPKAGDQVSGATDWGLMLVKGNVSNEESSNEKRIYWNDSYFIPWNYKDKQHESLLRLIGSGGSGVKMNDGTIVFPLEGTRKKKNQDGGNEKDGKTVSLIIYSKDTKSWVLSKGMSADGCSAPSVVEWEEDKLMMMTACGDGRRRVYESGDKGESWTEALGTLSRVWGNKKDGEAKAVGSGFITATIDDKKRTVMLVALPVYPTNTQKGQVNEKGVLHLWLTDNTHIVDIGPISGKDDDAAASALLYKSTGSGTDDNNEELIALYEKKGDGESSSGMVSVLLTEQLERVKDVLATWKEVDERVSKLCATSIVEKVTSPYTACSDVKITAGLVGFLSGNFSEKTWRDEYLGVNATVTGETTKVTESSDGVKFRGAWAEWPVGKQGENQLYRFANYNFTLVATVSIDGVPTKEGPIPVMGVKMSDAENPVLLGLSYNNKEKKWQMLCGGKPTEVQNHIEGQEKTQ
ncbi:c71 surface protein, partial [Trypanosoma cruzi]